MAGIDQALWDIKRKAYGVPVRQLLGGLARTKVRVYGHVTGNTAGEAACQARQRVAKGITFDEERAGGKPFRKPGLQPRLNVPDGFVRDF